MLTPDHLDTNSLFITRELNEAGYEVHLKSVVGDMLEDIAEALKAALQRSRLVIVS